MNKGRYTNWLLALGTIILILVLLLTYFAYPRPRWGILLLAISGVILLLAYVTGENHYSKIKKSVGGHSKSSMAVNPKFSQDKEKIEVLSKDGAREWLNDFLKKQQK